MDFSYWLSKSLYPFTLCPREEKELKPSLFLPRPLISAPQEEVISIWWRDPRTLSGHCLVKDGGPLCTTPLSFSSFGIAEEGIWLTVSSLMLAAVLSSLWGLAPWRRSPNLGLCIEEGEAQVNLWPSPCALSHLTKREALSFQTQARWRAIFLCYCSFCIYFP